MEFGMENLQNQRLSKIKSAKISKQSFDIMWMRYWLIVVNPYLVQHTLLLQDVSLKIPEYHIITRNLKSNSQKNKTSQDGNHLIQKMQIFHHSIFVGTSLCMKT